MEKSESWCKILLCNWNLSCLRWSSGRLERFALWITEFELNKWRVSWFADSDEGIPWGWSCGEDFPEVKWNIEWLICKFFILFFQVLIQIKFNLNFEDILYFLILSIFLRYHLLLTDFVNLLHFLTIQSPSSWCRIICARSKSSFSPSPKPFFVQLSPRRYHFAHTLACCTFFCSALSKPCASMIERGPCLRCKSR